MARALFRYFGVGFGGDDAGKGFVENPDNPLLLRERMGWSNKIFKTSCGEIRLHGAVFVFINHLSA